MEEGHQVFADESVDHWSRQVWWPAVDANRVVVGLGKRK